MPMDKAAEVFYRGRMPFEQGPIRPPSEAESLLLRLTRNCPWNRCTFCPVYKGKKFSRRSEEDILSDIDEVAEGIRRVRESSWRAGLGGAVTRDLAAQVLGDPATGPAEAAAAVWLFHAKGSVFLQDSDALVLPEASLVRILTRLRTSLPEVTRVTCYSRSATLARKKAGVLRNLREAGLDRVHVGMESGSGKVLDLVSKGATPVLHVRGGVAAMEAGLELSEYVMPGLGGVGLSREHAIESARLICEISPSFTRLRSLGIRRGSPLAAQAAQGRFSSLDDEGIVKEIRIFVEHLADARTVLVSDHILNLLGNLEGKLPGDHGGLLRIIDGFLGLPGEEKDLYRLGRRMCLLDSVEDLGNPAVRREIEAVCRQARDLGRPIDEVCKELLQRMI